MTTTTDVVRQSWTPIVEIQNGSWARARSKDARRPSAIKVTGFRKVEQEAAPDISDAPPHVSCSMGGLSLNNDTIECFIPGDYAPDPVYQESSVDEMPRGFLASSQEHPEGLPQDIQDSNEPSTCETTSVEPPLCDMVPEALPTPVQRGVGKSQASMFTGSQNFEIFDSVFNDVANNINTYGALSFFPTVTNIDPELDYETEEGAFEQSDNFAFPGSFCDSEAGLEGAEQHEVDGREPHCVDRSTSPTSATMFEASAHFKVTDSVFNNAGRDIINTKNNRYVKNIKNIKHGATRVLEMQSRSSSTAQQKDLQGVGAGLPMFLILFLLLAAFMR